MDATHKGFIIRKMIGNIAADIGPDPEDAYTEVTVTGFGEATSFDLEGLRALITDLESIEKLATSVEATNKPLRETH